MGSQLQLLQYREGGPHYISLHVGPFSPCPQHPCLFREPEPFKATFGLMSPLSANDPQRDLLCITPSPSTSLCSSLALPLLLSPFPPLSLFSCHFPLLFLMHNSLLPCLAHFLLPAAPLFSQTCYTLCSFLPIRTPVEPPSF